MPVRFRCCYCSQLLGISRRKIGTVIQCPHCLGQVWVPDPDQPVEENPFPAPYPGQETYSGNPAPPGPGGSFWPGAAQVAGPEPPAVLVLTPARKVLMALVLFLALILFFRPGCLDGPGPQTIQSPGCGDLLTGLDAALCKCPGPASISRMHEPAPLLK